MTADSGSLVCDHCDKPSNGCRTAVESKSRRRCKHRIVRAQKLTLRWHDGCSLRWVGHALRRDTTDLSRQKCSKPADQTRVALDIAHNVWLCCCRHGFQCSRTFSNEQNSLPSSDFCTFIPLRIKRFGWCCSCSAGGGCGDVRRIRA